MPIARIFALGRLGSRSVLMGTSRRQHAIFNTRSVAPAIQRQTFYSHSKNFKESDKLQQMIEEIYRDRTKFSTLEGRQAVENVIAQLDAGTLRVCSKVNGVWNTHAWIKQAVLLYISMAKLENMEVGPFSFYDQNPIKRNLQQQGVRVKPPGVARYGSFLEPGCVLMPGYVNIGAYVGAKTMVDTFATVGSCAQIGKRCHLSGGVGIGGVLEPAQASPVIIGDDVFIGSRAVVVEGVQVGDGAILSAGVVLTASLQIINVCGPEEVVTRGVIPPRAVVIPGTRPKVFPAGTYNVPCALIIGERTAGTDRKVSLNDALRTFCVPV